MRYTDPWKWPQHRMCLVAAIVMNDTFQGSKRNNANAIISISINYDYSCICVHIGSSCLQTSIDNIATVYLYEYFFCSYQETI